MMILNLTQHDATPEQSAVGVVEPVDKALVKAILTFDTLPSAADLRANARALADIASAAGADAAMIGGAPFFMAPLAEALGRSGIRVLYAFSRRESVESAQPDGSVRKTQVFRHAGFIDGTPTLTDRHGKHDFSFLPWWEQ